ncbi:hypothetical protein Tsubulata_026862 [Turnera subulata]|uniref:Aminotransferase class IV n=1 Tax=Turnera subulata TaxID=218843 RepID=A0A9Q0JMB1_9ROSI|nr:hypothetical protein Tsubulata_026862 [Turnera subulata]
MGSSSRFLFANGTVYHSPDIPPVANFLQSHSGAYTTTRTHCNGQHILFWERHLKRLADSVKILSTSSPQLFFSTPTRRRSPGDWDWDYYYSGVGSVVNESVNEVLSLALRERRDGGEELAITALVSGDGGRWGEGSVVDALDVRVHVDSYAPPVFGAKGKGASVAVVGPGRDVAQAKYSDWAWMRKPLEKLRPPLVTEMLLSNDGDRLLEGSVTNFFVVCSREKNNGYEDAYPFELQTAPVSDGVLPGVIRQLVIEVCKSKGIPLREVAPSWSECKYWQEAFITSSLRIVQHVEKIQVPSAWESLKIKSPRDIKWDGKQFADGPGMVTSLIQNEIMEKAGQEVYSS